MNEVVAKIVPNSQPTPTCNSKFLHELSVLIRPMHSDSPWRRAAPVGALGVPPLPASMQPEVDASVGGGTIDGVKNPPCESLDGGESPPDPGNSTADDLEERALAEFHRTRLVLLISIVWHALSLSLMGLPL